MIYYKKKQVNTFPPQSLIQKGRYSLLDRIREQDMESQQMSQSMQVSDRYKLNKQRLSPLSKRFRTLTDQKDYIINNNVRLTEPIDIEEQKEQQLYHLNNSLQKLSVYLPKNRQNQYIYNSHSKYKQLPFSKRAEQFISVINKQKREMKGKYFLIKQNQEQMRRIKTEINQKQKEFIKAQFKQKRRAKAEENIKMLQARIKERQHLKLAFMRRQSEQKSNSVNLQRGSSERKMGLINQMGRSNSFHLKEANVTFNSSKVYQSAMHTQIKKQNYPQKAKNYEPNVKLFKQQQKKVDQAKQMLKKLDKLLQQQQKILQREKFLRQLKAQKLFKS